MRVRVRARARVRVGVWVRVWVRVRGKVRGRGKVRVRVRVKVGRLARDVPRRPRRWWRRLSKARLKSVSSRETCLGSS